MKDKIMAINIFGYRKESLIDWRGNISDVLFCGNWCNKCSYCFYTPGDYSPMDIDIYETLKERRKFVDHIVVTGGDPLDSAKDLLPIIVYMKDLGYQIKLNTSNLIEVLDKHGEQILDLVDYISLGIKDLPPVYWVSDLIRNRKVKEATIVCHKEHPLLAGDQTISPLPLYILVTREIPLALQKYYGNSSEGYTKKEMEEFVECCLPPMKIIWEGWE